MNLIKVSKVSAGQYNIEVNGLSFFLEDSHPEYCGCARVECWVLWNTNDLEIMRFDTKKYAIQAFKNWTPEWICELNNRKYLGH